MTGQDFEVTELDLDPPKAGEVLIRYVAAGLCHSDEHLRHGDIVPRFPMVGGHEGAGIIEEVGDGVTRLKPGDHVICSFLPVCGHCRWCSTGKSNLCDLGANLLVGCLADGTYRFHCRDERKRLDRGDDGIDFAPRGISNWGFTRRRIWKASTSEFDWMEFR